MRLRLAFILVCVSACGLRAETIRTVAEVRALPSAEAARRWPVEVEGVVLGGSPHSASEFFFHDGTTACFVRGLPEVAPAAGDRVRVSGFTDPAGYYPCIGGATVEVLGAGVLPEPLRMSVEQLYAPELDSAWVEVPALVLGYDLRDRRTTLDVRVFGMPFKAELPLEAGGASSSAGLVQRNVRLRAVLGTIYNRQNQLTGRHFFVPSFREIVPEATGMPEASVQRVGIGQILSAGFGPGIPVEIAGVVTQAGEAGFYVRDATASTFVYASPENRLPPGARVRVAGFGEVAPFRPVLRAVRVAAEGRGEPPPPVPVDEGGTRWADMQFEYVVLTATFLGVRQGLGERLIECAAVGQTFQAIAAGDAAPLPRMGEGDVIRLSGICELTTTHLLPRVFWVDGFRVRLPGEGGGVEVVRRRPWWTSGRLLGALAITSAAALAGVLASWALGRQVRRQMGVIAEKLRGETVAAERNRIARDLHDTLEQQLYGVALKLDGLSGAVLRDAAEAEKSLALVRQMLEFTRLEARRSIWDLRSEVLEREGLAEALRGMAANLSGGGGPSVSAKVEGEPRRLSGAVEFHLFRIAQEAATNALRHAGAREIGVGLEFGERRVRLEVRDDGRGFDPDAARRVREGHFGLTGMRERAAKIGATLEVVSRPGAGCLVAAEVEC